MWIPIRDRQKEPTAEEMETDYITLQSLHDAVTQAQKDKEEAYTMNPTSVNKNADSPEERKWSFVLSSMDGKSGGLNTPRCSSAACSANTDETFHVSSAHLMSHICLAALA